MRAQEQPISRKTPRLGHAVLIAVLAIALIPVPFIAGACSMNRTPAREAEPLSLVTMTDEPTIRVRLMGDATSLTITGPDRVRVISGDTTRTLASDLTIRRTAGSWLLTPDSGETQRLRVSREPIRVTTGLGGLLEIDGKAFPGELYLHADTKTTRAFDVVEHVSVELYLPGVLARELYRDWTLTAYRAQAIAARSYALHESARRRSLGSHYDVVNTTMDQAYIGATSNPRALSAARDTRGMVLEWGGEILRAYYSSTTGGRAASASDVWPTDPGFEFNLAEPIQAANRNEADEFSPLYRWEVTRDRAKLSRRIRAHGAANGLPTRDLRSLKAIEVAGVNRFGRPTSFRVIDQSGNTMEVSAEAMRVACNTSRGSGLPSITREERVNSSDATFEVKGDKVVITGRGFGHGVGMSQYGAEGMARAGETVGAILGHYYPGAEIVRAY